MFFFDDNSWYITHSKLDADIEKLENQILLMRSEIEKDKKFLEEMNDDKAVEKYLRETYKVKTKGEEVFLIEHDTIN